MVAAFDGVASIRDGATKLAVDNYFAGGVTGVGDVAFGSASVPVLNTDLFNPGTLNDFVPFSEGLTNNHSGVQQWYRWTIAPGLRDGASCDGNDLDLPLWWEILNPVEALLMHSSLNPCGRGWVHSLFNGAALSGLKGVDRSVETRAVVLPFYDARAIHGCEFSILERDRVTCHEASSAFARFTVVVPADASYIRFRYRFPTGADGDYAVLFLDGEAVWRMPAPGVGFSTMLTSGPIPLGGRTGAREVTVALFNAGDVNAGVEITDFEAIVAASVVLADAGSDQKEILEAASPAGAAVILTGTGSMTTGEPVTFEWSGPFGLVPLQTAVVTLPVGSHSVELRVIGPDGHTGTDSLTVLVRDTAPPVVTPPGALNVVAGAMGAIGVGDPKVAAFLLAARANDVVDERPTALVPQIGGQDVTSSTVFGLGTTIVTFRFQDASGNIGTATSQVTVVPACAANVTGLVKVARGGLLQNRTTGRFVQTVTVTNTSTAPIDGPVSLVLDSLSLNATLYAPVGVTGCAAPTGSSYVAVNAGVDGILSPGETGSVVLEFVNPSKLIIAYTTRVLAGPGAR